MATLKSNPTHRKTNVPVNLEYALQLKKDLAKLALRISSEIKLTDASGEHLIPSVEISGGLSIPLAFAQDPDIAKELFQIDLSETHFFYRPHNAIHLSVNASNLPKLEKRLASPVSSEEPRYALVTQKASVHDWEIKRLHKFLPFKWDLYLPTNAKEAIEQKKEGLRFVKVDEKGEIMVHKERLDYIDVYPYIVINKNGEEVKPWFNGKFSIEKRIFSAGEVYVESWDKHPLKMTYDLYQGFQISFDNGAKANVVNLPWTRLIKEERNKQDEIDKYDIDLIKSYRIAVEAKAKVLEKLAAEKRDLHKY